MSQLPLIQAACKVSIMGQSRPLVNVTHPILRRARSKPGNIMLVVDRAVSGGERLKLLDFGIAHLGERDRTDGDPETRTGQILGTPRYMAPEQCRSSKQVDGKANVYSLGVVLYQALAGRPPFKADSEMGVLTLHLTEPPPPLAPFAPEVSEDLVGLVHLMLEKDPAKRPSMQDVKSVLYALGADEPPPLPQPLDGCPAHRFAHRDCHAGSGARACSKDAGSGGAGQELD